MYPKPGRAWGLRVVGGCTRAPAKTFFIAAILLWKNDDIGIVLFYSAIYNSVGPAKLFFKFFQEKVKRHGIIKYIYMYLQYIVITIKNNNNYVNYIIIRRYCILCIKHKINVRQSHLAIIKETNFLWFIVCRVVCYPVGRCHPRGTYSSYTP